MKKSVLASTKLKLSRETLRELQDQDFFKQVEGAAGSVRHCTVPFTNWPTCDPIT
jgi:hypothetical protein